MDKFKVGDVFRLKGTNGQYLILAITRNKYMVCVDSIQDESNSPCIGFGFLNHTSEHLVEQVMLNDRIEDV